MNTESVRDGAGPGGANFVCGGGGHVVKLTFVQCVSVWNLIKETKSLSCVQLFVTPWTIQSMEFSRPEYWNG